MSNNRDCDPYDHMMPTTGLQKRECPKCHRTISFNDYQTWIDHLETCDGKRDYGIKKKQTQFEIERQKQLENSLKQFKKEHGIK